MECSKKEICACGHNGTGDASPALDVHHMPTHVDKVGAMFRVVSAAARMISSCRLLIANKRLEECIDPYDTCSFRYESYSNTNMDGGKGERPLPTIFNFTHYSTVSVASSRGSRYANS